MSSNKSSFGMLLKHFMLLVEQLFKRSRITIAPLSFRVCYKLQPPFVVLIYGIPKRLWIGSMNKHRNFELATFCPNGIESFVINCNSFTCIVFYRKTEALKNL